MAPFAVALARHQSMMPMQSVYGSQLNLRARARNRPSLPFPGCRSSAGRQRSSGECGSGHRSSQLDLDELAAIAAPVERSEGAASVTMPTWRSTRIRKGRASRIAWGVGPESVSVTSSRARVVNWATSPIWETVRAS